MLGKHHHLCLTSKPAAPKWLQLVAAAWLCRSLRRWIVTPPRRRGASSDGQRGTAARVATDSAPSAAVAMASLHHGSRSGSGVILLFAARRCEYRVLRGVPFESRLRNQCLCTEHAHT